MEKTTEFPTGHKNAFGAMDVIVVDKPDGNRSSTPFYVCFSNYSPSKSSANVVEIQVNQQKTSICMRLNKNGEAKFFRENSEIDPESPTSPEKVKESEEEEKKILDESVLTGLEAQDLDYNLTCEELRSFPLNLGINIIHFVLRDHPNCHLIGKVYLWESTSKIIVSDVDGTLTKSDFLGHLCYFVGIDWSKGGSVYLYTVLTRLGYKLLYLTARSLSQLSATRTYLNGIREDGERLPDGPLLLNPCGMWKALVSEMSKKSKVFKAEMLKRVRNLFLESHSPLHAGIGNREGDAIAYASAGIPTSHIFIINKKRKEKGEFVSIKNFKDPILNIGRFFPALE